jgi:hypothetical protein
MTDLEKEAMKQGQSSQPKVEVPKEMVTRDATQIQAATRDQLESLSDYVAEQLNEAVVTRSSEKLALHAIQNSDRVVKKAIGHLESFLPKILEPNPLMFENELEQLMGKAA